MLMRWRRYSVTGCRNRREKLELRMVIVVVHRVGVGTVVDARARDSRRWLVIVVDTEN